MTDETAYVQESNTARRALISGITSVTLAILYFTPWVGAFVLYGSVIFGIVAIVFGALALKRHEPKGIAISGLMLGVFSVILGLTIIVFALVFVGAL